MLIWYLIFVFHRLFFYSLSTNIIGESINRVLHKHSIKAEFVLKDISFFPPELKLKKLEVKYRECSIVSKNISFQIFFKDILNTKLVISDLRFNSLDLDINSSCLLKENSKKISLLTLKHLEGKDINLTYKNKRYFFKTIFFDNRDKLFLNTNLKHLLTDDDNLFVNFSLNNGVYKIEKLSYKNSYSSLELEGQRNSFLNLYGHFKTSNFFKTKELLKKYISNQDFSYLDKFELKSFDTDFKLSLDKKLNLDKISLNFGLNKLTFKSFFFNKLRAKFFYKNKKFKLSNIYVENNYTALSDFYLSGEFNKEPKFKLEFKDLTIKKITKFFNTSFPYLETRASGIFLIEKNKDAFNFDYLVKTDQLDIFAYFAKEKEQSKILYVKDIKIKGKGVFDKTYKFFGNVFTRDGNFKYKIEDEKGNVKISYDSRAYKVNQNISMVNVKSNLTFKGYTIANKHYAFSKTYFTTKNFRLFDQLQIDNSDFTMYIEDYVLKFANGITPLKNDDKVYSNIVLDFSGDKSVFNARIKTDAITLSELFRATGFDHNYFTGVYKGVVDIYGLMSDDFTYRARGKIYDTKVPNIFIDLGDLNVDASVKGNIIKGNIKSKKIDIQAFPRKYYSELKYNLKSIPVNLPHSSGKVNLTGTLKSRLLKLKDLSLKGSLNLDRLGFFPFVIKKQKEKFILDALYKNESLNSFFKLNGNLLKDSVLKIKYKNLFSDFVHIFTGLNIYSDFKATGEAKLVKFKKLYLKSRMISINSGNNIFKIPYFWLNYTNKKLNFSDILINSEGEKCKFIVKKSINTYLYKGCLNSAIFRIFFPFSFSGYLNTNLSYKKNLNGLLNVKNTVFNINNIILELNGDIPVKNGIAKVDKLALIMNNNPVLVNGSCRFFPHFVPNISFNLLDIPISYDKFYGYFGGVIKLSNPYPYLVSGKLLLRDVLYRFDKYSRSRGKLSFYDAFRFDVLLNLKNIILDSSSMNFTLDGRGKIKGKIDNYSGVANLKDGRIKYMDREFDLEHGTVKFDKGNYNYNVSFNSNIDKYLVSIDAKGKNTEKIDFNLSSSPFLTEGQIISLLMTGNADKEASSPISHIAITNEFKKQIGFDVGINYKGLQDNMSIELKKDLSKNIKLKYNRDIANVGEQKIDLEYRITKNLDLDASVRGDTSFDKANNSIGVKFKHEF